MIQSRWSKVLGILPLVGALAAFSGCAGQGGSAEETGVGSAKLAPAAEAQAKGGERMRGHHMKHGQGPDRLLVAALHELDLSDAQRSTIEGELKALREAKGEHADRADFEAHRTALAAAIRSGKVDEAALQPPAAKGPRDPARLAKAMQTLHDTLTADQRKELVDAVSAKLEKFDGHRGPKGEMGGPLEHMLRGIELTDAQREKVREALAKMAPTEADREAMKAQHEAFRKTMRERLATFAADRFDASAFVAPPKEAPMFGPGMGPERMVKALAAVVPILDDAQRAELAKRVEAGPFAEMHHGGEHDDCPAK